MSQMSFSEAFFSVGTTGSFKNRNAEYVQNDSDHMFLVSLNGVNLGSDTNYKDKIGFSLTYGWGEYTHEERLFTYKDNRLLGLGFNFPINNLFYVHLGGNIYWTKTKFKSDEKPNEWSNTNETLTGYQIAVGTELTSNIITEIGYSETLDTFTFQVGYRFY
jgi:hypothetical protein